MIYNKLPPRRYEIYSISILDLAVPPYKELAASKITLMPPDFIAEKLDENKEYISADNSMYRSPIEKSKREINVACASLTRLRR